MMDFADDMRRVVAIEALGIGGAGNADCFAIADVLLRAIERQWSDDQPPRSTEVVELPRAQ